MKSVVLRFALGVLGVTLATTLHAAEVTLRNAWMRPAPAGAEAARAYVDIDSAAALELVGASTPIALETRIVLVKEIDNPASEQVVPLLAVPAGTTTRLAFRGDHLRLVGITRDVANGDPVPLTLTFRDSAGKEVVATTGIVVRGLLSPQQIRGAPRAAQTVPAAPPSAPGGKEAPGM